MGVENSRFDPLTKCGQGVYLRTTEKKSTPPFYWHTVFIFRI